MTTTYESATTDLIAAIERVVEAWLLRVAIDRYGAHRGEVDSRFREDATVAARDGARWTIDRLRSTLEVDVDAQRVNPLQVLREAVRFPSAVLSRAGVPPVVRDEYDERINPDDIYGIGPAHWNDIDESLTELGIVWGAAKASTVLQRRRAEGKLES